MAVERFASKNTFYSVVAKGANVLQQGFSLLLLSCVDVGGVAEFRPVSLRFYFETTLLRRENLTVGERSYFMRTLRSVTLWQ